MNETKKTRKQINKDLREMQQAGIQADETNIKKDMCAQFTDTSEWIREYVVNSYDAGALKCRIWCISSEGEITVFVMDNGHGMDKQGISDFFTLYRSRKKGEPGKTVGQFGIGKLSVAAIPGQKRFKVTTSNGKECWVAEAGNLLSADPIRIYRISDVPPQGTLFEITFTTKEKPEVTMLKLSHILRKYTSNLPIIAEIHIPDANSEGPATIEQIGGEWSAINENYGKSHTLHVAGGTYEVITGVGQASHEIYQNKVLISDRYNLISHDISNSIQVPNIRILINSSAFELPFGRHCLRNESVLNPLAQSIREQIIPAYFDYLISKYDVNPDAHQGLGKKLEEIAVALVIHIPDHNKKWANIPLFRIYPDKRVSLLRLEAMVTQSGKVYLEETENTGADYACFDAPILLQDQPQGCIKFLKEYFRKELINLSLNDVVIEMPATAAHELTNEEKRFQENLGLASGIGQGNKNKSAFMEDAENDRLGGSSGFGLSGGKYKKPEFANPECDNASDAYRQLRWKVNYLVGRDGKTPCLTHRFIVNHNTIVLNLYHPDVKDLVKMSLNAPGLSSHWAVALCLTEDNKILSFLSAESREDLLLVDALLKLNASNETAANQQTEEYKKMKKSIRDLLRDTGIDFGVN